MVFIRNIVVNFDTDDVKIKERAAGVYRLDITQHRIIRGILNTNVLNDISSDRVPSRLRNNVPLERITDGLSIGRPGTQRIVDCPENNGTTESIGTNLRSGLLVARIGRIQELGEVAILEIRCWQRREPAK